MAMQCDRPSYSLTNEDINEINNLILGQIAEGKTGDLECDLERDEGTIHAEYYENEQKVYASFEWADRDGDEDYFDLEEWLLKE